jgi:hypothetical protein
LKYAIALLGLLLIISNFNQLPSVWNNISSSTFTANGIASIIGNIVGFLLVFAVGILMMWFGLWRKSKK